MSKLNDLYQIQTIEQFGEVAKLCDEKELDLLLADFKGCLLSLRLIHSCNSDLAEPVQLTSFNWSPLPQFPDHLLETEGEGIVVTIEEE